MRIELPTSELRDDRSTPEPRANSQHVNVKW